MSASGGVSDELLQDLMSFETDPLGFVLYAFPWGEGELAGEPGPDKWQTELLQALAEGQKTLNQVIRLAVASGHGVGKSALVSWLILWAMTTKVETQVTVTANTEVQLRTKTWAQLAKWHRLFIGRDIFKLMGTSLLHADPQYSSTWRADMIPWSEHNPAAFAGLHKKAARILIIFDEASAIHDIIWETAEGGLTDAGTEIIWAAFGNPTTNDGRFRECWGTFAHRWKTFKVDSRTSRLTNKGQINEWIEDYGLDSDFVRIRVLGEFPKGAITSFIPRDLVQEAQARHQPDTDGVPLVFGVDVARYGDNDSVIFLRRGLDGTAPFYRYSGIGTMELAARVADLASMFHPEMIFVDEGGVGGGVVDRLRQLRVDCIGVNFGAKPDRFNLTGEEARYKNKRSEMWGSVRDWLHSASLIKDEDLFRELIAPAYTINETDQTIVLEKKEDMRRRGVASPDIADALALTFAYPVAPRRLSRQSAPLIQTEWDPFALEAA